MTDPDIYKRHEVKKILQRHSLALKRRWGQNFLTNFHFAEKIAQLVLSLADPRSQSPLRIWEIGPGLGSLSAIFLSHDVELTVFEIDHGIIRFLEQEFYEEIEEGKLRIIAGDAEKSIVEQIVDADHLPQLLCGNLPYCSTVRILISLCSLEQLHLPAVYMIQKEAVARLMSSHNQVEYGLSSVLMQSIFSLSKHFSVSADSFFPVPNVASTVFSCKPLEYIGSGCFEILCTLLRTAFNQRRKKVHNTLVPLLCSFKGLFEHHDIRQEKQEQAKAMLLHFDINQNTRAEEISVSSYVRLTKEVHGRVSE